MFDQWILAAVGSFHRQSGLPDPTRNNTMLHLMRRGIKRLGNTAPCARRQPITTPVLFNLLVAVRQSQSLRYHDQHMIAAAFTMAFFGFLRVSEFTVPTLKAFNSHIHPSAASIHWSNNYFLYHLKHSKTDQFSKGHTLRFPRLHNKICPYKAMARYFKAHKTHSRGGTSPLFTFADGHPLTRQNFLANLRYFLKKAHYPARAYNTHSFRIGAATTAAQAGMSAKAIKRLGRWKSKAYRRYISQDPDQLHTVSPKTLTK